MTKNMGTIDRAVRLLAAAALAYLAFATTTAFSSGLLFWVALIIAVVFTVTALAGNCPLYSLLGIRTCRSA